MELLEIQAVDVMNYPFTRTAQEKFWGSPEMDHMRRTALRGRSIEEIFPDVSSTAEEFVAKMDLAGYEYVMLAAVKMGSYRRRWLAMDFSVDEVYELIHKYPNRLIGLAGYDPFSIYESVREIERAVQEYRFKGVYAHTLGWGIRPNDRRMYPCYLKCVELNIPFAMQIGHSLEVMPSEAGRPFYIDEVALDFPELKFIASHTGWPWCEELTALAWKHQNVYIDISAHLPRYLDHSLINFMESRGQDKILFGTNGFGMKRCKEEFLNLTLPEQAKVKVLRQNALKVFRLGES
ncbi:MAG: amidohydrolase [Deltaproteobacteria bacterium]|nr:amidohydrolase [Deltaproteobacteria bacterium]